MTFNAVAVLRNDSGVQGTVFFKQDTPTSPVVVKGEIKGLEPGEHGFHVHQFGDTTNGCISAGPHFNVDPKNHHGGPKSDTRHNGDLGNVLADENGVAKIDIIDDKISLVSGSELDVKARSLVIHAKRDDLGQGNDEESLKTGNAGARFACGIIGLAKSD